jgi:hypothetical protein
MPKCEILVREKYAVGAGITMQDQLEVVELWKRFDGEPKRMFEWFQVFTDWVQDVANTEPATVLKDANIMAALMIVCDQKWVEDFYEKYPDQKPKAIHPDIRPRGNIVDAEYLYCVDLPLKEDTTDGVWRIRVRCWRIVEHNGRYLDLIHEGKAPPQKSMEQEQVFELTKTNEIVAKMRGTAVPSTASSILEAARESVEEEVVAKPGQLIQGLSMSDLMEQMQRDAADPEKQAQQRRAFEDPETQELLRELSKDPGFAAFTISVPKRKK